MLPAAECYLSVGFILLTSTLLCSSLSFLDDIHSLSVECTGIINMAIGRSNSWRTICLVTIVSFICMISLSYQSDTILPHQSINSNQTIISRGGIFELGFFSWYGNDNNEYFHVEIRYKKASGRFVQDVVVWTANGDTPINSSDINGANLMLTREGDLQLQVNGRVIWNTNTTTTDLNTTKAVLLDNGNLIVGSDSSPNMWESFNYPTDTWLPGAKIGLDASTGKKDPTILTTLYNDSFGMDLSGSSELLIWDYENITTARIGASDFLEMNLASKMNITFNVSKTNGVNYATYRPLNDSTLIRIQLDWRGPLLMYIWDEKSPDWKNVWTRPYVCHSDAPCGSNGICSMNQNPVCSCPKGFEPKDTSYLELHDYSGGCVRRNGSQCLHDKDEFVALHYVHMPANYEILSTANCRLACAANCSCSAYSHTWEMSCRLWYGDLLGMEQLYDTTSGEIVPVYLRSGSPPKKGSLKLFYNFTNVSEKVLRITLATSISFLILVLGSLSYYIYRKKITKGAKDRGQDLLLFNLEMTNKRYMSQVQSNRDNKRGNRDLALPIFSLSSVFSATDNFSSSNKLGEGGFGPVYKGKLRNGQEVAVKRLSKHSGQGLEELINEAKLIAELQHTNLVRLLGCCIQKDEKILIYEYMPNKSLDFFLFVMINKKMLDWSRRMCIIDGIAQGLLYLHHYARLRIIHRDLKASNILLDAEMKPKISDFGMARIFGGNQLQANTKHIVGTLGYMPPEYALEGLFSIKTDVFSFGVLLLEILSGERNTSFRHEDCLNLIGYAWKLWTDNTPLELLDPILKTSCDLSTALTYIHVGLLCVQEHPDDRPSILDIVAMIGNEMKVIKIQPKQPAYLARRRGLEVQPERFSLNELTYSTIQPR